MRHSEVHEAAGRDDVDELKQLLEGNPDLLDARDEYGLTPLHKAAARGKLKAAQFLITKGSDVNLFDEDGRTPLYWASIYDHREVVELLVKNVANVNAKDKDGKTPLHAAKDKGHRQVAEFLTNNGAVV